MTPEPAQYRTVLQAFNRLDKGVRNYLQDVESLIEEKQYGIALAYGFALTERVEHTALYGGLIKTHRCDTGLAWKSLDSLHVTREKMRQLLRDVFKAPLPKTVSSLRKVAEDVRDRFVHGKEVPDKDHRVALVALLKYAEGLNAHIQKQGGFSPFRSLQGIKGRAKALDRSTTRWVLKGIGFDLS